MYLTCQVLDKRYLSSCNVLVAERTALRRLISLICAGWLPHDNRFVGELPFSKSEDQCVATCLIADPRVLPPLSILLPTHCITMISAPTLSLLVVALPVLLPK